MALLRQKHVQQQKVVNKVQTYVQTEAVVLLLSGLEPHLRTLSLFAANPVSGVSRPIQPDPRSQEEDASLLLTLHNLLLVQQSVHRLTSTNP